MIYAEFKKDGREILGSDGVFILDGRNTLLNQITDCYKRIKQLKNVKPWINGFAIRKGERFSDDNVVLYDEQELIYLYED